MKEFILMLKGVSKISNVSEKDRNILRKLAFRVREISESNENNIKKRLWIRHNDLKSEKPMILVSPEGSWVEILKQLGYECENKNLHWIEAQLKMSLYNYEVIKDDRPLEPYFNIGWEVNCSNFGVEVIKHLGGNRGSYTWEPPIKDIDKDFNKLRFRELAVDRQKTFDTLDLVNDIFGDILICRINSSYWWSMGLTWAVIDLLGLENFMFYMYDNPEGLHRVMGWMRDEHLNFINWFEKEGLLSYNNENNYVGSGGLGYTRDLPQNNNSHIKLSDLWGLEESQETVGISPDMFAEFILPYQIPLAEKFGLNCYGCCEGLDKRIDHVFKIPKLRRISVAPWANQEIMAERLGKNYIYSRKPNPSHVCIGFNEDDIRKDIQNTLKFANECNLEIILKDTHTVENKPWKLSKWVDITRQEINKFYK